ncbi:MAG: hypothetical protein J1E83_09180 [Lachnospiraceae bacterium]|nr:hypothetical protein [Lachnospiraceae bacterium]
MWGKKARHLRKCIIADIRNMLRSPWFVLSTAGLLILLLVATGYTDGNGRSYSVAGLLFISQPQQGDMFLSVQSLLGAGPGEGMYRNFACLFIGLPFVMHLSAERSSGYIRFLNYYAGTKEYVVSKSIAGLVGGGLSAFFSYFLFALTVLSVTGIRGLYGGFTGEVLAAAARFAAGCFLYGFFAMGWTYFFAAWMKDKYVLLCFPFLCRFLYQQILFRLMNRLLDVMNIEGVYILNRMNPSNVVLGWTQKSYRMDCAGRGILLVLTILLWLLVMNRRLDRGE